MTNWTRVTDSDLDEADRTLRRLLREQGVDVDKMDARECLDMFLGRDTRDITIDELLKILPTPWH